MQFIENISRKEYDEFLRTHPANHFLQLSSWGDFCQKAKNQIPHYVGIKKDNKLILTALILEKKTPLGYSYGYSPKGFITDYENQEVIKFFTNEIKKYMKRYKYIYIRFEPEIIYEDIDEEGNPILQGHNNYKFFDFLINLGYQHQGFNKLYEGNQPRYSFIIDLKQNQEEINNNMAKSFLKGVKRSYNYDLIIDNQRDVKNFYRLIHYNSKKDGFFQHSLKYYEHFNNSFLDNNIKFFNAYIEPLKLKNKFKTNLIELEQQLKVENKRKNDLYNQINKIKKDLNILENIKDKKVMICSLICVYTHNKAWSLYIGSNELANLFFAVSRCYYLAIMSAKEKGYQYFDLFGTTGNPHTTYKNLANLHDFKKKMGGTYVEFIGDFDLINKKFLYRILPKLLKIYRKIKKIKI